MKTEIELTYPDYKAIQEESRRIDCTISQADFSTSRPNPHRINIMIGDISRYLKYKRRYATKE